MSDNQIDEEIKEIKKLKQELKTEIENIKKFIDESKNIFSSLNNNFNPSKQKLFNNILSYLSELKKNKKEDYKSSNYNPSKSYKKNNAQILSEISSAMKKAGKLL